MYTAVSMYHAAAADCCRHFHVTGSSGGAGVPYASRGSAVEGADSNGQGPTSSVAHGRPGSNVSAVERQCRCRVRAGPAASVVVA